MLGDHQPVRQLLVMGDEPLQLFDRHTGADPGQQLRVLDLLDEGFAELREVDLEILRRREVRHQGGVRELVVLAFGGDLERRGQCLGVVGEQRGHLLG